VNYCCTRSSITITISELLLR